MKYSFSKNFLSDVIKVTGKGKVNLHEPVFFGNEKKYLKKCIDDGYVSYVGKYVNLFEKKIKNYTKSKYCTALINGTSALHILLREMGVEKNDEVILPSLTFVATANAIRYCHAIPNFVDIEEETLGISPEKLEKYFEKNFLKKGKFCINRKTKRKVKILIAVHLFGMPCKIISIKKICAKYNIKVIEDAAEALGSFLKKKHLGNFSEAGVISFNGNKTITCGGGAVVISSNKSLIDRIRHLSTTAKIKHKWEYIHDDIGYNYRMTNLNAAVGCAQIENIKKIIKAKRNNYLSYKNFIKNYKNIKLFKEPKNSQVNYWLITILFKGNQKLRNIILKELNNKNINCRALWKPLHLLKMYKDAPRDDLSSTINIYKHSINLPSSPSISLK